MSTTEELIRLRLEAVAHMERWARLAARITRLEEELNEANAKKRELMSAAASAAETAVIALERLERAVDVINAAEVYLDFGTVAGLRSAIEAYRKGQPS